MLMLLPDRTVFGILCKFTAFRGTLHWLVDAVHMGHVGEFLSFSSSGLLSEKGIRPHVRAHYSMLIQICACVRAN